MPGMIQGGWEYVNAAYAVSAFTLLAYAVSVALRLRAARRDAAKGVDSREAG